MCDVGWVRRGLNIAAMAMVIGLPSGCQAPAANTRLLDGLDEALTNVSAGQQLLRSAAGRQLDSQQQALDEAFEADLRNLAVRPAATSQPAAGGGGGRAIGAEPFVRLADVLDAKRIYDQRRAQIDSSRSGVHQAFDRLDNNVSASAQMVHMLRQLANQQNGLAAQTNLAIDALVKRTGGRTSFPAAPPPSPSNP